MNFFNEHKKALCFVAFMLLFIALLWYLVYGKKKSPAASKKGESKYMDGYWYIAPGMGPDPYSTFPSITS